jgi:hypothetical protein
MGTCMLLGSTHCNLCTLENKKHIWVQPNHTSPHTSARTLSPVPTNLTHTRRTQSAHPPAGAQLCTRHGSTTTWLHTHQTHPQEKAHLPDLKHYTRHQGSAETATNASQNTVAGADKLSTHTALSIGAPTAWRITLHQTRLHGCIHTRHTHQLYQAWPHGHPFF